MKFRIVMLSLAALCGLALTPALVAAQSGSDAVPTMLKDHVYVASNASPSLSAGEASDLAKTIRELNVPVYVAVVPQSLVSNVDGNYNKLPGYYGNQLGRPAVVAVIAGRNFRAGSSSNVGLAKGQAGALADQAFSDENPGQNGGQIYPMLDHYVHLVAEARSERASAAGSSVGATSSSSSSFPWLWLGVGFVLLIGLIVFAVALAAAGKKRRLREQCEAKLQACGEEVYNLEAEATLDDEHKTFYDQGVTAYNQANEALASASTSYELSDVLDTLNTAQRCFQRARGIIATEPAYSGASSRTRVDYSVDDDLPRARRVSSGRYYYDGGTYNGVYYAPGYYNSDRFWEGLYIGEMLADRDDDRYDHDRDDDDRGGSSGDTDWSSSGGSYESSDSGGGSWGSDSSSDSGGSDFGGFDSGGSDFGGSFDSGDSGGGSW